MVKKYSGWLLMFLIFIGHESQAQQARHDIKGYVRDAESGEGLPFANVAIAGTKWGTVTNTDGYFILVDVQGESCTLIVSYIGYIRDSVTVDLRGSIPLIQVQLQSSTLELQGVTVSATPMVLEVAKEISRISLSPKFISSLPSIGQVDVFRTLQLLPGINASSSGSSELYVRGGKPDQNLILFDGMTIYHVDHFFGFFSAFNADAIKDIQVYKGGFPAEYGGRISSVVNLTGKTGNENKAHIDLGINLLSANVAFETPIPLFEKTTLLLAARRSYTDFIQSDFYDKLYKFVTGDQTGGNVGGGFRQRGGGGGGGVGMGGNNLLSGDVLPVFYFYDLNGKLTMSPSSRDIVSISLYNGRDDLDKSQDFGSTTFMIRQLESEGSLKVDDFTRWGNFGVSGKWSHQWSNRLQTDLLVAGSEFYSDFEQSSNSNLLFQPGMGPGQGQGLDSLGGRRGMLAATIENNAVNDLSVRADARWHLAQEHQLGFGVWFNQFDARYVSRLNDTTELLNRHSNTQLSSFYLQDKWSYADLDLTFGLRSSYYQETQKMYWEPRVSFVYSMTPEFSLKGAWGYYHQFVNRITNENVLEGSREFWLIADKQLLPSFAEHQILGLNYENNDYVLSIEAYNKNLDNLVEFSRRLRGDANYANAFFFGSGTAKGVEFLLQKKAGSFSGWIGYTLAKVEYEFPKINNGVTFPAEHDHRHDVKAVAKYALDTWTFAANWTLATGNAYTAPESQYFIELLNGQSLSYIHISGKNANRLPDFHQLDVSVSKHFESTVVKTEVGLSIFNVYNRKNVSYRQYNLTTVPATVTDIALLGITPTLYVQFHF
ncbi:MAG: TonB-dependent receptor [bacterium]